MAETLESPAVDTCLGETPRTTAPNRWQARCARAVDAIRQKASVFETVGTSFGIFALSAVQGVLLARILGPAGRGELNTATFYAQTFTYVGLVGTIQAVARRAAKNTDATGGLVKSCLRLGLLTSGLTIAVVSALSFLLLPDGKQYLAGYCVLCALFLVPEHLRLLVQSVDHGAGRFRPYNLARFASAASLPLLLMVCWFSGVSSLGAVSSIWVISPLLGLGCTLYLWRSRDVWHSTGPSVPALLREGRPFALAVVATDLLSRLDMFLVLWLASFTIQGFYAVALPACSLLAVAPHALGLFAFNAGARHDGQQSLKQFSLIAGGVGLLQIVCAIAYALVMEPLIVFVFGEAFRDATPLVVALLPAAAIAGWTQIPENYLRGYGKPAVGVWSRVIAAIVMLGTVAMLYGRLGIYSVPTAAVVAQAAIAVCVTFRLIQIVRRSE